MERITAGQSGSSRAGWAGFVLARAGTFADFLKQFCSDKAEPVSDPSARGPGFDGARLRQLTEQLFNPIRAALRRA